MSTATVWHRRRAAVVLATCLPALAACGGKSAAQKTADAAAQAKAACEVFANFHPKFGSSEKAQTKYAQASARAFHQAADHARLAANESPQWAALASSASKEAAAFDVIVRASTVGFSSTANEGNVFQAAQITRVQRPIFVAQCVKADPTKFTASSATASPGASPTAS